jgi:integrase
MAHLREKKGNFYAEFYDRERKPRRRWVPLDARDRRSAVVAMRRYEKEYLRGRYDPWALPEGTLPPAPITLKEQVEAFLQRYENERTKAGYRKVLTQFRTQTGCLYLEDVTAAHVQAFLDGRKAVTQRNYYAHLRAFLRASGSPATDGVAVPPARGKRVPKALRKGEYELLLGATKREPWFHAFVQVAWITGMRPREILALRWSAIDAEGGVIYLSDTKTDDENTVPYYAELGPILATLPRRNDLVFPSPIGGSIRSVSSASHTFLKYRKELGIRKDVSLYGLRHGFGSFLAEAGVHVSVIQEAMRHRDTATTMLYIHAAKAHVRKAVEGARAYRGALPERPENNGD